jgi:zinc protease
MKRFVTLLLFTLVAVGQGLAQGAAPKSEAKPADAAKATEKAPPLPTVDQILDKYVQAIGGRAAIEKLTSRAAKGTFEMPAMGLNAPVELYAKAPNRVATTINISGFGTVAEGYDGKTAWARDPTSGLREKGGVELATARLDAEFHKELKLRELYPKMELKGREKVGEREAYVVLATPPEGSAEKWYFDAESGLLVRSDVEREGPQGKLPFEIYLEDYREVDGVKMPFTSRMVNPSVSITIRLEEVKHNVAVDEAKFAKPRAQ